MLPDKSSIKAGYSFNYQYVHLTSLSAVSLPTDIWYPTTDKAKPQSGWQTSIGYFKNFDDDKWETSIEAYYKGMNNLIEYREGALPGDNVNDNFSVVDLSKDYILEFKVFNRWGQIVYDNATEAIWDGKFNGELQPRDMYIFTIVWKRPNDPDKVIKRGSLMLLR
jgi:gliding motility-associated-like protein